MCSELFYIKFSEDFTICEGLITHSGVEASSQAWCYLASIQTCEWGHTHTTAEALEVMRAAKDVVQKRYLGHLTLKPTEFVHMDQALC